MSREAPWAAEDPDPLRVADLLDGLEDADRAAFWTWFNAVHQASGSDNLLAAGLGAWAGVVNHRPVVDWWESAHGAAPPLDRRVLIRGLAGAATVRLDSEGLVVAAEDGDRTAMRAVTWCAVDPGVGWASAEAVDLIVMNPDRPEQWWRYTEVADVLPDAAALYWLGNEQRIRLYETPLAWLAAGCPDGGFCVLDWTGPVGAALLADIDAARVTVICDDVRHAARLRALARPKRQPLRLHVQKGASHG